MASPSSSTVAEGDLASLRSKIDSVDRRLVTLLNERANISLSIGEAKKAGNNNSTATAASRSMDGKGNAEGAPEVEQARDLQTHIYMPAREKAVFERLKLLNHGPLSNESVCAIYREIMSASISLQQQVAIAYLGPPGTFSYQAATERFGDSMLYKPQNTIGDVFEVVRKGKATYGVVPFENSTYGSVVQTLDQFKELEPGVSIRAETYLLVRHALLSNSPKDLIRRIYSHNEAFGQCQKWLERNMKSSECVRVHSTAKAAELAAIEAGAAAICSISCAELYGLSVVAHDIEDVRNNMTRFFILASSCDQPTGDDRTYLRFTVDHRQPGALADALRVFKAHGINLTKIDSRPSPLVLQPWHYVFFVEFIGHADGPNISVALRELNGYCLDIRVLGSYPNQRPEPR